MKTRLVVKIYTKPEDDRVMVIEGLFDKQINEYYYPVGNYTDLKGKRCYRLGTTVIGAEYIGITEKAKALFKEIVNDAEKTRDDVGDLAIYRNNNKACIAWYGDLTREFNADLLGDVFIGIGRGLPNLDLLDTLVKLDEQGNRIVEEESIEK